MKYAAKTTCVLLISGLLMMPAVSAMAADKTASPEKTVTTEKAAGKTAKAETAVTKNKIAADVNGTSISMADLDAEYNQTVKQMQSSGTAIEADKVSEVKKELLDGMINQELLFQESKKQKIAIEEESVTESFAKVKTNFADEKAYQAALKEANITEETLLTRIRRGLAINNLVDQQITQKLVVSDTEVKEYYDAHPDSFKQPEQVRASHILVKIEKDAKEADQKAAQEKIEKIEKRVKAGEDFAALAKENSDCPSKDSGGDLGFFSKGQMVQEFEDAAFTLKPGEASGIVKSEYGYHIIKVTDKKDASAIALETVKEDLSTWLKKQKTTAGLKTLLETLKKDAKIQTYL